MNEKENPTVEVYRGVIIRKYNRLTIRIDSRTMKELIDASQDNGISLRQTVCISGTPCAKCVGTEMVAYINGKVVKVKKGIISKNIPSVNQPDFMIEKVQLNAGA